MEENEISVNSNGGTEQVKRMIGSMLPEGLLDDFQVICSRVRTIDESKIRVYWIHDLPNDPETNHIKDKSSRDRFHKIVFCGNWQYNQYLTQLNLAPEEKFAVIDTPIIPFEDYTNYKGNNEEIRLIYTSTPQRGLSILVPVFIELAKKYPNIHLDVFSSFKIYGWEDMDKQFEPLYDMCRNHPQITYHGFAANDVVRDYISRANIFAYPSIWMECNSRALIEAMSAGCICVHPNLAGLSDTSGNLTDMYQFTSDPQAHAQIFYKKLDAAIDRVQNSHSYGNITQQRIYANYRFDAKRIAKQWETMLLELKEKYPEGTRAPAKEMFVYRMNR
jgi:UDP-glucose:(glucosyl)LPS alpha-1,2-glucosyltransferase